MKEKYNVGYTITVNVNNKENMDELEEYIEKTIQNCQLEINDLIMSIKVPYHSQSELPEILDVFDNYKNCKRIISYKLSVTTMEQVYLNSRNEIFEEIEDEIKEIPKLQVNSSSSSFSKPNKQNQANIPFIPEYVSSFQIFNAMLYKNILQLCRNTKAQYVQYILPIFLIGLSILFFFIPSMINISKDKIILYIIVRLFFKFNRISLEIPSSNNTSFFPFSFNHEEINIENYFPDEIIPQYVNLSDYSEDICSIEELPCFDIKPYKFLKSMSMSSYLLNSSYTSESSRYGSVIIDSDELYDISYTLYVNSTSSLALLIYNNVMGKTIYNYYNNNNNSNSNRINITMNFGEFHIFFSF